MNYVLNGGFRLELKVFGVRHMVALFALLLIKRAEEKYENELYTLRNIEYEVRERYDLLDNM